MKNQTPQVGDIWKDYLGHFLVLEEHPLTDSEKRRGYVCEINILALDTGKIEAFWTINTMRLEELTFVA